MPRNAANRAPGRTPASTVESLGYGELAIALHAAGAESTVSTAVASAALEGLVRLGGREAAQELSQRWTELNLQLLGGDIDGDTYLERMAKLGLDPSLLQRLLRLDYQRFVPQA